MRSAAAAVEDQGQFRPVLVVAHGLDGGLASGADDVLSGGAILAGGFGGHADPEVAREQHAHVARPDDLALMVDPLATRRRGACRRELLAQYPTSPSDQVVVGRNVAASEEDQQLALVSGGIGGGLQALTQCLATRFVPFADLSEGRRGRDVPGESEHAHGAGVCHLGERVV